MTLSNLNALLPPILSCITQQQFLFTYLGFDPYHLPPVKPNKQTGFDPDVKRVRERELKEVRERELKEPTDKRMFVLAAALKEGYSIEELHRLTDIDEWFLYKLR